MKKIILLLVFIIPLISISQNIDNSSFAGNVQLMKGAGTIKKEYSLEITISNVQENQVSVISSYHSGSCVVELIFDSTTADGKYIFHEKIKKCGKKEPGTDNGTVILELINNDQVLFHWYYPSGSLGEKGVLSRIYSSVY